MIKPIRILNILSKKHIKRLPFIILAMLIGAGFEVVGLSLIIPLLDIITNASQSKFVGFISSNYPMLDSDSIIIFTIAFFGLIYIFKGLYLALLARIISKFVFGIKVSINKRLIQYYINVPYEFVERREGDVGTVVADNSLANKLLNWKPKRTIRDMCKDGWEWELNNVD